MCIPSKQGVDHEENINPNKRNPFRRLYKFSSEESGVLYEYIPDLLERGGIRKSNSPFRASIFFPKLSGRDLRAVFDYRDLNRIKKQKKSNRTLCENEVYDRLGSCPYFTEMDFKTRYLQFRIGPQDIEKTAFKSCYGQVEYLIMPMRFRNARDTFFAVMNEVLRRDIDISCAVCIECI